MISKRKREAKWLLFFCISFLFLTVYYYIEHKLNKKYFGGTYYEYEQI
nr:MAG TPA: hypothetical protein [Caudoviricetes sp.]